MQDWALQVSDAERLDEFCDAYERGELDDEVRFGLMELILFSLDEAGGEADAPDKAERVERLLQHDFLLHLHTLDYWRLPGEDDPENVFAVTALARRVWAECYKPEHKHWREEDPD